MTSTLASTSFKCYDDIERGDMYMWKDIKGYEELYQISDYGEVKSLERFKNNYSKKQLVKEHLVAQFNQKRKGIDIKYKVVTLWKDGHKKNISIHRLVAVSFLLNPLDKPTVDHIDCDPSNNKINNLRWATRKEQSAHMVACEHAGKNNRDYIKVG